MGGLKLSEIKKYVVTGMSFMIPMVVSAGLCMAPGTAIGKTKVSEAEGTLTWYIWRAGKIGMGLVVPAITAAIAYFIADRPAIAPGLILGSITLEIYTGLTRGIITASLVDYMVLFLKKYLKVPKTMRGLVPVLILPLLTTLICGALMSVIVGKPVAFVTNALQNWLIGLQRGSEFILETIVGGTCGADFGGPIGETASLFTNDLPVGGIYRPGAVRLVACMIPPMGVALSYILTRNKYTKAEKGAVRVAFPIGICVITEGATPLAMSDPLRAIGSSVVTAPIAGGPAMILGIENYVTAGGWFITPLSNKSIMMTATVVLGDIIIGVISSLWKKIVAEDDPMDFGMEQEDGESIAEGMTFENF